MNMNVVSVFIGNIVLRLLVHALEVKRLLLEKAVFPLD